MMSPHVYVRTLVLVISVVVPLIEAQSLLEREVGSLVFLQCVNEMIFDGFNNPSSIPVSYGFHYDRNYAFCSSPTTEWESQEDVFGIRQCAFRAFERGAFMFKFTSPDGCQVALNNDDARSQPPCVNPETVYIVDEVFCVEDGQLYREGETTDEDCRRECTEGGLVGPEKFSNALGPKQCCPTSTSPCIVALNATINICKTFDFCSSFGFVIPSVEDADNAKRVYNILQNLVANGEKYGLAWVDVFKDNDGVWRHGASRNPVDDSLWGPGELSNPGKCAVATAMSYIKPARCEDTYIFICQGFDENFPRCESNFRDVFYNIY